MWQEISIGILFFLALLYLGRIVYKLFTQKEGCASGCSCDSVSLDKIEEQIKKDSRFNRS